jgi:hypothetical protein
MIWWANTMVMTRRLARIHHSFDTNSRIHGETEHSTSATGLSPTTSAATASALAVAQ